MAPLDRLAAGHRLCLHWAGRLQDSAAPATGAEAAALRDCFDDAAPRQQAVEAGCLFPALTEAMAGSDAVCLRQMTLALAADQLRLQALWRRLRASLMVAPGAARPLLAVADAAAAAAADPDADAAADLHTFASLQTAHSQRMLAELLPLAGRLLDDAALAHLNQAMRACDL